MDIIKYLAKVRYGVQRDVTQTSTTGLIRRLDFFLLLLNVEPQLRLPPVPYHF